MKKFLILLAAIFFLGTFVSAQEIEEKSSSEKLRLDILIGDTIGVCFVSAANTTNLALRLGVNENHIGFIAGGMFREGVYISDLKSGFPSDFYWSTTPYIGVELWNVELLGGVEVSLKGLEYTPYLGAFYLFNIIKQKPGFSDRLTLKVGLEHYVDAFTGDDGTASDFWQGLGDILTMFYPRISIGIQYSFGWGF